MNITDSEIKKAFDHIPDNIDAIRFTERVMKEISKPEKKIPNKRYIIIASVLALLAVSVVTVGAAKLISRIIPGEADKYMVEMKLQPQHIDGDVIDQLWDYCSSKPENRSKAAYEYGKKFENWAEVSDYLKISILKNKLLGDVPENMTGKEIFLVSYADTDKKELMFINVSGTNMVGEGKDYVFINIGIPLTQKAADSSNVVYMGEINSGVENNTDAEYEEYTSVNGIAASIAVIAIQYESSLNNLIVYRVSAYFINNGLGYEVSTTCDNNNGSKTNAVETIKKVIDGYYE